MGAGRGMAEVGMLLTDLGDAFLPRFCSVHTGVSLVAVQTGFLCSPCT